MSQNIVDLGCVSNRSLIKTKTVFVDKILYIFIITTINNVHCANGQSFLSFTYFLPLTLNVLSYIHVVTCTLGHLLGYPVIRLHIVTVVQCQDT